MGENVRCEVKRKNSPNLLILIFIVALLASMAFILIACDSGSSQTTQNNSMETELPTEIPDPDGETLLNTRCSTCHRAERVKQDNKTREQWEQTVTRMISKGARMTESEKELLLDYLVRTHGPQKEGV
jgi:hypothetical protein